MSSYWYWLQYVHSTDVERWTLEVTDVISVALLKSVPNINSIHHAPALSYHHLPATLGPSHPR